MKNIIVGTAGHIDHGKTTLIKALTGRNTDRWEEEQRRGITIDLGFTYFDLPSKNRVGIIDVPGHEKFINNMAAGVVGMDLVLLVIAADEGIMPQTREHIDILEQLGLENSIIVLNKCDLVDDEWIELVKEDIRDELKGSFFEKAPVVEVSAAKGSGLGELTAVIDTMTRDELEEKDIYTIPRLPVDRVFSLSGFGTIVTGTLISGQIKKEDQLQIFPLEKECKIRSIQVHGEEQQSCYAGQRVAINLSNVKKKEIGRGCVIAPIGSMKNTMMLDVRLNILKSSMRVLENRIRLHLFTGTSEVLCRAVLLDVEEAGPGDSCYAQLRLEEEVAVRRGDRFIVRFYSPMETIGGGVVLDANPSKKKRFDEIAIKELQMKEEGSHKDALELLIKEHSEETITVSELAKLTALTREEVMEAVNELVIEQVITTFELKKDIYVWHKDFERKTEKNIVADLRQFHEQYPYKRGRNKSELRMRHLPAVKQNVFDLFLHNLIVQQSLFRSNEYVTLADFEVVKDKTYQRVEGKMRTAFTGAMYNFVRFSEIDFDDIKQDVVEDILLLLLEEGKIVKVSQEFYTLASIMEEGKAIVTEKLQKDGIITIAEVRDLLNTSRKNAKPLLEYFDSIKVTKRNGTESERISYL